MRLRQSEILNNCFNLIPRRCGLPGQPEVDNAEEGETATRRRLTRSRSNERYVPPALEMPDSNGGPKSAFDDQQ
jgi:hypothetical protein